MAGNWMPTVYLKLNKKWLRTSISQSFSLNGSTKTLASEDTLSKHGEIKTLSLSLWDVFNKLFQLVNTVGAWKPKVFGFFFCWMGTSNTSVIVCFWFLRINVTEGLDFKWRIVLLVALSYVLSPWFPIALVYCSRSQKWNDNTRV